MLNKFQSYLSIFLLMCSQAALSDDSWESCSRNCKGIPPLSESILSQRDFSRGSESTYLAPEERYRLVVWNIHKQVDDGWAHDFRRFTRSADFVLVQEAVLNTPMDRVINELPHWDMAVSFYLSRRRPTGVITGSRLAPFQSTPFRSRYREPFTRTPKMILSTTYRLKSGQALLLVNIHAMNFRRLKGLKSQLRQVKSLLKSHKGPVIFAGDFNSKNRSRMAYLKKYFNELRMRKVVFPGDERSGRNDLDQIFYRGIDILEAKIILNLESSDHPLLGIEFNLN